MAPAGASPQPSSRSRGTNAADQLLQAEAVAPPKKPIVGSLPYCCVLATSGHAAAPPSRDDMASSHMPLAAQSHCFTDL